MAGKDAFQGVSSDFSKFSKGLKKDLKKLRKEVSTDEKHLALLLYATKLILKDDTSIIEYYFDGDALENKLRLLSENNIPSDSILPSKYVDIILKNITNVVSEENVLKFLIDKTGEIAAELKEKNNKADQNFADIMEILNKLYSIRCNSDKMTDGLKEQEISRFAEIITIESIHKAQDNCTESDIKKYYHVYGGFWHKCG